MRSDDPASVREQYATEQGLAARASIYGGNGVDARDFVIEELRSSRAERVLEVGCGWGELAARIANELGAAVRAIDQSPRMVELARERDVDASVADVQALPFDDGVFDAVVAAWMLYHVPDLDLGLGECARTLRPGGILVAVTNGVHDFAELWALVGRDVSARELTFRAENGEHLLRRHFHAVRRRDVVTEVVFPDSDAIRRYVGSSIAGKPLAGRVPELAEPFAARKHIAVFVAEKRA